MRPLTEKEHELFGKVLDLNYEMIHEINPTKKKELFNEFVQAKTNLRNEMGEETYNEFIEMGTKMFAPKQ